MSSGPSGGRGREIGGMTLEHIDDLSLPLSNELSLEGIGVVLRILESLKRRSFVRFFLQIRLRRCDSFRPKIFNLI